MRHSENYCWYCGKWAELPFYKAVCRKCYEIESAHQRGAKP